MTREEVAKLSTEEILDLLQEGLAVLDNKGLSTPEEFWALDELRERTEELDQ